jgi:hypothetical protein
MESFRRLVGRHRGVILQSHDSAIAGPTGFLVIGLVAAAAILPALTNFTIPILPNIIPLVACVVVIDFASQFAPRTRIVQSVQMLLFGILCLVITCLSSVIVAYASQRFAFPLQDRLFENADAALGLNWLKVVHWADGHPDIPKAFRMAYDGMSLQIGLPVIVLALANRLGDVRAYLLAFVLTLVVTIVISMLLPAGGPIISADLGTFNNLRFTGATPIHHLMLLREPGPLVLNDAPGGIATFPSFHAAIAVLTPLTLRRYRPLFLVLLLVDGAMLCGTITEGAHYFSDVLAGGALAISAHLLAQRMVGMNGQTRHVPLATGSYSEGLVLSR